MVFQIKPDFITREVLLLYQNEEAYFTYYLGIVPTKGLFKNPLRVDRKPSCSFKRIGDTLYFKDFATGVAYDFVSVVAEKFCLSYGEACMKIAGDFGIIMCNNTKYEARAIERIDIPVVEHTKEKTIIQVSTKEFSKDELEWWNSFGVSKDTLDVFNVYSVHGVFINGELKFTSSKSEPIFGYFLGFDENGVEDWKIYFPTNKKFRFLLNNSKIQGLDIALKSSGSHIVVTKSMKDVMTLYEAGIPAIAPQSECAVLPELVYVQLDELYDLILFNGDWDNAGKQFMIKNRRKYPKSKCITIRNKDKFGKDVSDFVKMHGRDKLKKAIDKLKKQQI